APIRLPAGGVKDRCCEDVRASLSRSRMLPMFALSVRDHVRASTATERPRGNAARTFPASPLDTETISADREAPAWQDPVAKPREIPFQRPREWSRAADAVPSVNPPESAR